MFFFLISFYHNIVLMKVLIHVCWWWYLESICILYPESIVETNTTDTFAIKIPISNVAVCWPRLVNNAVKSSVPKPTQRHHESRQNVSTRPTKCDDKGFEHHLGNRILWLPSIRCRLICQYTALWVQVLSTRIDSIAEAITELNYVAIRNARYGMK